MSRGLATGIQKSYGATSDILPNVDYAGLQFSPTELYNLCENATTNVYTIHTNSKNLERALKNIGTERDSRGLRDNVHVIQLSCNQVVAQTTKDLQRLKHISRKTDKQQKLQIDKLTNDFKEAVQCYGNIQKQVADKMKIYLLTPQIQPTDTVESDQQYLLEEQEEIAKQKRIQRDLQFETELLLEREQRIRQIEGDILDVNQIMRELGALIHEQGAAVDSIENHIENVHRDVELGEEELQKAAVYQGKARRKLCFLLLFAIILCAVLAVIIAIKVKS